MKRGGAVLFLSILWKRSRFQFVLFWLSGIRVLADMF